MQVGYKWFPYSRGGDLTGDDRELEAEIWFEHPGSTNGEYLVVHSHFATKWVCRKTDPEATRRVTAVNIRHAHNSSRFWKMSERTYQNFGAYSEGGAGHLKVAAFEPPWDRDNEDVDTGVNGTKAADLAAVLSAGLGSAFYYDRPNQRTIGDTLEHWVDCDCGGIVLSKDWPQGCGDALWESVGAERSFRGQKMQLLVELFERANAGHVRVRCNEV